MSLPSAQSNKANQAIFSIAGSADINSAATVVCSKLPDTTFVGGFHQYFSPESHPELSPALKAAALYVALVDCDGDPELALTTMSRLRTILPRNLNVVAYGTRLDPDYLVKAMRVGCNEFLTKPANPEALHDALIRFGKTSLAHMGSAPSTGRVLSFFGAKGGTGTTTLAVHTASNLVRRHHKRVLLIDHHHELGHVGLHLGLRPGQYYFDELIRNADRLDSDLLNGFVIKHPSGLHVLLSPDVCAVDHEGTSEELQMVLAFLRTRYEYVVVDSCVRYKNIASTIQELSDEVYFVCTPDLAALRDLSRRVGHFSPADSLGGKIRIVINRATADDAISIKEIAAAIRFPVWTAIPNNYADLVKSINVGEPISPQHRSAFAQHINKWGDKIVGARSGGERMVRVDSTGPSSKKLFALWPSRRSNPVEN